LDDGRAFPARDDNPIQFIELPWESNLTGVDSQGPKDSDMFTEIAL